jgi:hypothetical protein
MRSESCPKCEAKEVHIFTKTAVEIAIPITWMTTAGLDSYICTNFGYVELFVKDKLLLPKIAEKYAKVG